jgi:predicted phage tail protein
MKTVYLHGEFGERFGEKWELNVDSPAEAIRALDVNTENQFTQSVWDFEDPDVRFAIVCLGERERNRIEEFIKGDTFDEGLLNAIFVKQEELLFSTSRDEIHFIPVVEGEFIVAAKLVVSLAVKAGAALKGAMGAFSLSKFAFNMLVPMAISGIANALFPSPKVTDRTRQTKSYLFDDRPNTTRQGSPVPVGYGVLKIGSNTLSFGRTNKDKAGAPSGGLIETYTMYTVNDVLSEGPIGGLCDSFGNLAGLNADGRIHGYRNFDQNIALKSIFLNDMVVMNHPTNTLNFLINEDNWQPKCNLGFMDTKDELQPKLMALSEVEVQGSTTLPGPEVESGTAGGALKLGGMPHVIQSAQQRGAKVFASPITKNRVGEMKITLSPKQMFHNWTDQRSRRGFFGLGARSSVTTGTSAQSVHIVARIKDGRKSIPLIEPPQGFGGGEGGTVWAADNAANQRVVNGALRSSDRRADPLPWAAGNKTTIAQGFAEALFAGGADGDVFSKVRGIIDFCEKFHAAWTDDSILVSVASGNNKSFKQYLADYSDGCRSYDGSNDPINTSDPPNALAAVLMSLAAQIQSGVVPKDLSYRNYDEIMSLIKKSIITDMGLTLGADGFVYNLSGRDHSSLVIKGIATSPAGLDVHVGLPYFGKTESLVLNLCRLTLEITDPKDMKEKARTLHLSAVTKIDTLMGRRITYEHPGIAMVQVPFDAVNFPQLPERNYVAKLKRVAVPANYNTKTRKYFGAWNGLFKGQTAEEYHYGGIDEKHLEWTDNPAWILLDILLNQRYGIGTFGFTIKEVDIWRLYAAAKFCDELVETGFPLEYSKRSFTSTHAKESKDYFIAGAANVNYFDVTLDPSLDEKTIRAEFNGGSPDKKHSRGKSVAFFMSDNTIEERDIISVDPVARTLRLMGPSFAHHPSATGGDSNKVATGTCVMSVSYPIVEPRFSANILFKEKEEALRVIKEICTIFRTVVVYSAGKISFASERKKDPSMMFTDANVGKDGFSYSGSPKTSRVTAAKVRYADRYDNFRSKVEYFEDSAGIDKFGYKLEEILAVGCTSRGQARRLAKFTVLAPALENEYVTFETGMEAALLVPGSILEISDSRRFGENVNGRIKSVHMGNDFEPYVKVDKIMNNLSFYNPDDPTDGRDKVELAIVCGRGYEFVGDIGKGPKIAEELGGATGLYRKMFELSNTQVSGGSQGTDMFDEQEQLSLISGISRPQVVYFDGHVGDDKSSIEGIKIKFPFQAVLGSHLIASDKHGLANGAQIKFTSLGKLPSGIDSTKTYTVLIDDAEQQINSFKIKDVDVAVTFEDIGFAKRDTSNPSVPGGEHFYYMANANDIQTTIALGKVGPGAVWSIRGYRRDIVKSLPEYDDAELQEVHDALGGVEVPGSAYRVSPSLGRYRILYIGNNLENGTEKMVQILQQSAKGKGLGDTTFVYNVGIGYDPKRHYRYDQGGWLKTTKFNFINQLDLVGDEFLIEGTGTTMDTGKNVRRVSKESDIFSIVHGSTTLSIGALYKFAVTTHGGIQFIRVSGGAVSSEEVSGATAPGGATASAIEANRKADELDINSFRNVGRIQYRVQSVSESEAGKYRIKASEYNRDKFDLIERELNIEKPVFPIPPQASMAIPDAPSDFSVIDITNSLG